MTLLHLKKSHRCYAWPLKLMMAAGITLAALGPVGAKPPAPPAVKAKASEASELSLSSAQKAQSKAYQAKMQRDLLALKANKKLSEAEKQTALVQLEKQYDADMLGVLTPAQRAMVGKKRDSVNAHYEELKAISPQFQKSLTPEQKQKITAIMQSIQKIAQPIMQDQKLSNSVRMSRLTSLGDKANAQILVVLNPSQRIVFNKMARIQHEIAADQQWGMTAGQ